MATYPVPLDGSGNLNGFGALPVIGMPGAMMMTQMDHKASDGADGDDTEQHLTAAEIELVDDSLKLSAPAVYSVIRREGEEELARPTKSLWWSGIAAGIGISTSVLAEGVLSAELEGYAYRDLVQNFGYTVGFVLVILARLQLFTENTITPVLPVLARASDDCLPRMLRLWGIVFAANMIGTFLAAAFFMGGTVTPEHMAGMMAVSHHYAEAAGWDALVRGIPAGFLVAVLVWMLPSSKGFELWIIMLFTFLIAAGDFTHVVAGAVEVFLLILHGELGIIAGVGTLILPTLIGNVIGGTVIFTMLAYAQVQDEITPASGS